MFEEWRFFRCLLLARILFYFILFYLFCSFSWPGRSLPPPQNHGDAPAHNEIFYLGELLIPRMI